MLKLCRAILGAYFLSERLHLLGKIGCAICLTGSLLVVANAPLDKEVSSVEEILELALRKGTAREWTGKQEMCTCANECMT